MTTTEKFSKDNVKVGDRVLVTGCDTGSRAHWGTVLEHYYSYGVMVEMDDPELEYAKSHETTYGDKAFYAYWGEVVDHAPQGVASAEQVTRTTATLTPAFTVPPLEGSYKDIQDTLDYLEKVTGKKHTLKTQEIELGLPNGSLGSGYIMIKFTKEA